MGIRKRILLAATAGTALLAMATPLAVALTNEQTELYEGELVVSTPADARGPVSLSSGDVDDDGDLDILSASSEDDRLVWYENLDDNGRSWETHVVAADADGASSVATGDIDGDGDLDAVSASRLDDRITWYENTASGTVWTTRSIADDALGASSVAVADLDGDGDMDVLAASFDDDTVAWYENRADDGSLWAKRIISVVADGVMDVKAADFDGDGDLDVVSASATDGRVLWFRNRRGDGSDWTSFTISADAAGARSVAVGDVDGDDDLDVMAVLEDGDRVLWYENQGGSTIQWRPGFVSTSLIDPTSVSLGDVDNDGDLDAVTTSAGDDKVAWFQNRDGDGTFWVEQIVTRSANGARALLIADVDDDLSLDVVAASFNDNKITLYRNRAGDGSNWEAAQVARVQDVNGPQSAYAADVDGDGDLDVLAASSRDHQTAWFENLDTFGTEWRFHVIGAGLFRANTVAAGDIDGDGDIDVLSASQPAVSWHKNVKGDGSKWETQSLSTNTLWASDVTAVDMDGDGDLDALSTSRLSRRIAWHENRNGDGTLWTDRLIATADWDPSAVAYGDIDGDGDLDVLSAFQGGDRVLWYENRNGDASAWGRGPTISSQVDGIRALAVGDMDGDGNLDVLTASSNGHKIVWHSNTRGDGSRWSKQFIGTLTEARDVMVADPDRDGDLDVIAASFADGRVVWFENVDGDASTWSEHPLASGVAEIQGLAIGDLDGDKDSDVLSVGFADNRITWHENLIIRPGAVGGSIQLQTRPDPSGATVTVAGETAVVGPNGRFSFPRVRPGTYTVTVEHPGFLPATRSIAVGSFETVNLSEAILRGGDVNSDGRVDVLDLLVTLRNMGESQSPWE
ncbi:MAG: Carboxypeptidase regulatory-like domain-containing protein [Chloroflexi bacterium]|jgi:hypothetical protein|nr:MAG: Carboxypeptidase regulatory-like domain-containing protein [Chloroflexota bacterium]